MSTPGIVSFICGGNEKTIEHYMDSYPSGLGEAVVSLVERVKKDDGWNVLMKACKSLESREQDSVPQPSMVHRYDAISIKNQKGAVPNWGYLIGGVQGKKMLDMIYEGKLKHFIDGSLLAKSGACEYGYVINLDDMTLSFHDGCQSEPSKVPIKDVPKDWKRFFS